MQSVKTNIRKSSRGQAVYVEGSAARNFYVLPNDEYGEVSPKHSKEHSPVNVPEKKEHHRRRTVVRRETTILPVSGISVLILTVATMLTLFICVKYLQLQSELTVRLENINALETQLNSLVNHNNEIDKQLSSFVDLNYIYQVATEELGMHYANQDQITMYNNSGAEYVRQYEDIPD